MLRAPSPRSPGHIWPGRCERTLRASSATIRTRHSGFRESTSCSARFLSSTGPISATSGLCGVARRRLRGKITARRSRARPTSFRTCKAGSPPPRTERCKRVRLRCSRCRADDWHGSTYEPGRAADPVRATSRTIRLDRNAAARPRRVPVLVASARPKQPPRADHRRPEELLDHHLSPGPQGPSTPISQTRLARRSAFRLKPQSRPRRPNDHRTRIRSERETRSRTLTRHGLACAA